ncbi:MAG: LamG domain-containing protein [Pirellulaceae bacterium]|nr:LamG domain-containing protein [Pirellulaceae bacterium]
MPHRVVLTALFLIAFSSPPDGRAETPRQFRVWATSCAHVPADIRRGRESLAKVIRQSEGLEEGAPAFDWDIMIDAGDVSAHQTPPGDRDGRELIRQYRAMTKHRREQVYNVPGNHDAPYYDHGPGSWFRKWGDPLGENAVFSGVDPKRRPFPVEGTWERYSFQAGNILFLMLSDRNDAPTPVGRGHSKEGNSGGYPPGAVTRDTFNWWKQQVLDNQDKIIITMHHHALRDTTTASGYGEGNPNYHGSTGGAEGSSYLYFIIEKDDPDDFQYTKDAHVFEDFLDTFHKEQGRGAIDFWVAGHTHVKSPDDDFGGKTISETRWGANFLQVAGLTRYHGGSTPLSRVLTFTDGCDQVKADVYLHEAWYEDNPVGWYAPASKTFSLRNKFAAPAPIEPLPPFPEEAEVYDGPYERPELSQPLRKAGPSPDLTTRWDKEKGGTLHLEALLEEDADDRIDSKPVLVTESPAGTGHAAKFDGTQRLRVGRVDMEDWTDLTVSAWINTTEKTTQMRVASKDRIGKPGLFMLLYRSGAWIMQAWDDQVGAWCAASWRSAAINDGGWHSLVGVVDSRQAKVLLYVDGELKAEAPWTAKTLDDSDETDLAVGADSGEGQFGHTFQGMIHDVHLYPLALTPEQIKANFDRRGCPTPAAANEPAP